MKFKVLYASGCRVIPACFHQRSGRAGTHPTAPTKQLSPSPSWPQVLTSGHTKLTIYQPQLDSWDGYTLQGRAAVEATGTDSKSTYGIVQGGGGLHRR
ncbi:hypothetical protein JFU37_25450 [Pseudomonas sp. TH41]|uniref:hypothetical protein n=1 Tax=Pseudomonas sp. TH41 TaxID=2796405 RepID=UPI00191487BB|nr:hypothetical protein [Pseudomonas sp. TH41]MBK5355832.1 hypothetical protein [Pseudomonas sp. TH41]